MLIAILKNPYLTEEPIPIKFFKDTVTRPYLKGKKPKKNFGIDALICSYINSKYNNKGIYSKVINLKDVEKTEFDLLWTGSEYWAPNYAEIKSWKKYETTVKSIPRKKSKLITPPIKFLHDVDDKCKMFKKFHKLVNMIETKCKSIDTLKEKNLSSKKGYFFKPIPSAGSRNTMSTNNLKTSKNSTIYIKSLKGVSEGYKQLVMQKYVKSFASMKHPEIRTFWVGNKFVNAVKTYQKGDFVGHAKIGKEHPIYKGSLKILSEFSKQFKDKGIVLSRIDWGYDSVNKTYFFNELQPNPGIFIDYFKTAKQFKLDKLVGDHLVKLATD
jgi:hypothetical protein